MMCISQDRARKLDKLTEFLHKDPRISYVICSDDFPDVGPTLGAAVDLLFDYFITDCTVARSRSDTIVSTECDALEEQAIRKTVESLLDRLREIPESRFSLVFQIQGTPKVNFLFNGYDRQSAVRILGDFLALRIRDVWRRAISHGEVSNQFMD